MKRKIAFLSAAAACIISVAPANAATLLFTLTGSRMATFQLDSNPTPNVAIPSTPPFFLGNQIQFTNVPGTFGGVVGSAPSIGFGTGLAAAFQITGTSLGFTQFTGPAIFTGTANAPVFSVGTFALSSIRSGNSTLTITQVAAIPEPATWMMMLLGFGLIGASLRYGRRTTTVSYG